MSCNYADGLSSYENKGKLGLEEKFDTTEEVSRKVSQLAKWFSVSNHIVVHTGAGISTSAGIPDFRGPNGVWTLEKKGLKPDSNISFDDAIPTKTHMALLKLIEVGKVKYIVSQNIDGLHLRSGVSRTKMAELHGNMFTEKCSKCNRQFVRQTATTSVGQKCLDKWCPSLRQNGRPCRGRVHDTILDWEDNLPEKDLGMADFHSCIADLSICLGTTLQIVPSGKLPLYTKKQGGRVVICNLQPTKFDRKADLVIHTYVDEMMTELMQLLDLSLPEYDADKDPTKQKHDPVIEWTIDQKQVSTMRKLYEAKCCKSTKKRSRDTKSPKGEPIKREKNSQSDIRCDVIPKVEAKSTLYDSHLVEYSSNADSPLVQHNVFNDGNDTLNVSVKQESNSGITIPQLCVNV
uniref:protein acetyllysine N-acetyltransferase n=1 Tax=Timema californicum TaxID=61474 RepID=A0A7R9J3U0_TIMCA|nr:unnamed protein product [Timema californicum]